VSGSTESVTSVLEVLGRALGVFTPGATAEDAPGSGAIPELEWGRLDAAGLRAAAGELQRVISAVEHQQRRVLALIDERRAFAVDGSRDAADWAANGLGVSRTAANDQLRLARQLDGLPNLAGAAARGELSTAQAKPAAQLADPTTDRQWAVQAPGLPVGVLDRQAAKRSRPTSADHHAARRNRHFRAWNDGLELRFRGAMPTDDGQRLLAAIERAMPPHGRSDGSTSSTESLTPDQRRADGLLALASATIADDADPDRANVVLIADLAAIDAATDPEDRTTSATAELDDGTLVPIETARRLLCDSRVQVIVQDRTGVAVGVGTTSRVISPGMRRVLMQRDGRCRFGSCSATRFLHAHHIDHWPSPTTTANLALLCWTHHHAVHEGGWVLTGDPNGELRATLHGVTVTSHPRHGPAGLCGPRPGASPITAGGPPRDGPPRDDPRRRVADNESERCSPSEGCSPDPGEGRERERTVTPPLFADTG
jgi:hypothetical protein